MIKGKRDADSITSKIISKAIIVNTDSLRLCVHFSMKSTAGLRIIRPRKANTSIRRMGAACCQKSNTIVRGISHQRLPRINVEVLFKTKLISYK